MCFSNDVWMKEYGFLSNQFEDVLNDHIFMNMSFLSATNTVQQTSTELPSCSMIVLQKCDYAWQYILVGFTLMMMSWKNVKGNCRLDDATIFCDCFETICDLENIKEDITRRLRSIISHDIDRKRFNETCRHLAFILLGDVKMGLTGIWCPDDGKTCVVVRALNSKTLQLQVEILTMSHGFTVSRQSDVRLRLSNFISGMDTLFFQTWMKVVIRCADRVSVSEINMLPAIALCMLDVRGKFVEVVDCQVLDVFYAEAMNSLDRGDAFLWEFFFKTYRRLESRVNDELLFAFLRGIVQSCEKDS